MSLWGGGVKFVPAAENPTRWAQVDRFPFQFQGVALEAGLVVVAKPEEQPNWLGSRGKQLEQRHTQRGGCCEEFYLKAGAGSESENN